VKVLYVTLSFSYGNLKLTENGSLETKKLHGARSGEYGVCSSIGICFLDKDWQILWDHFFHIKICLIISLSIFNYSTIILMPK
jgi:hypothetical protein